MNNDTSAAQCPDFSLVLGGPLFQLWRRTHLGGDALELERRRILVMVLLAWLPLLVLSIAEGHAWGDNVRLTFPRDIEMNARLLLALPLLIMAELFVHQRLRVMVGQFLSRGLVPELARPRFEAAIASALRLRNSILAEVLLFAFAYCLVIFVWRSQVLLEMTSWYRPSGQLGPSLAGWWLGLVSFPIFQFLLMRWVFRLFIWARFLWQVSRIPLKFMPTHPDRSGGVGFLSAVGPAFTPLALAQGVLVAGMIANRIFYAGAKLPEFRLELIGVGALVVLVVFVPLLVFVTKLAAAKRTGMREYGILAQSYMREFDNKWLRGDALGGESLIGSDDIQSLADMDHSFSVVKQMKPVPFSTKNVLQLVVITVLPVAPLLLTMIPLEELMVRLIKVMF